MTQTLEQMLSPGSNIFDQPIFSKVFDGMFQIIRDTSKNPDIELPTNLELYQMLLCRVKSFTVFRNNIAKFKKRTGMKPSIHLAKDLSNYITGQIFIEEPSFQGYLAEYVYVYWRESVVSDGRVQTYESFSYQMRQA